MTLSYMPRPRKQDTYPITVSSPDWELVVPLQGGEVIFPKIHTTVTRTADTIMGNVHEFRKGWRRRNGASPKPRNPPMKAPTTPIRT